MDQKPFGFLIAEETKTINAHPRSIDSNQFAPTYFLGERRELVDEFFTFSIFTAMSKPHWVGYSRPQYADEGRSENIVGKIFQELSNYWFKTVTLPH
jgi:hypothetical protein